MPLPQQNTIAPTFTLLDQDETTHSLAEYQGRWVLVYFYPKDDTPGCTKEACGIRDVFPSFQKLNAVILGISVDAPKSHKKFVEKYNLPFTLLSDEKKEVVNVYGVWQKKKFMGKEYDGIVRTSFLINPKGVIMRVYEKVKPELHAQEVMDDLIALQTK